MNATDLDRVDYLVIGAGSAGCVVASRLTEDPQVRVMLLEAGPGDSNPDIHVPHAWPKTWNTEVDWAFATVPQAHCANQPVPWPRGKVLGGSSSINGMIYGRGHRSDYDNWAYNGCPGWDYESVLPYFKKSEDFEKGESRYHGKGGLLHVSLNHKPSPI